MSLSYSPETPGESAQGAQSERVTELEIRLERAERAVEQRYRELVVMTQLLEARDKELIHWRKLARNATEGGAASSPSKETSKSVSAPSGVPTPSQAKLERIQKRLKAAKKPTRKQLKLVQASPLFDEAWYLDQYPDLQDSRWARKRPLEHYLRVGGYEGRNPSAGFDSEWYLTSNPDVEALGVNPLVHYLEFGQWEGRQPLPKRLR